MTTEGSEYPSARGLQEGGSRGPNTPLRDFQGTFVSVTREQVTPQQGKPYTNALLNFTDVVVLASVEPYQFPTATIKIKESGQKNSGWGIYSGTLCELMPDEEDIVDQFNGVMRLKWVPGKNEDGTIAKGHDLGFKDKNWTPAQDENGVVIEPETNRPNVVVDAWEVMELNGAVRGTGAMTAKDRAISLLDGQTKANFNKATMTDTLIKGDEAFRATILDSSFLESMVNSGQFVLGEDQVYHKTGLVPEVEEAI